MEMAAENSLLRAEKKRAASKLRRSSPEFRTADAERARKYRAANAEIINARIRAKRASDPDKYKRIQRRHWHENREKYRTDARKNYEKNWAKVRAQNKLWREQNAAQVKATAKAAHNKKMEAVLAARSLGLIPAPSDRCRQNGRFLPATRLQKIDQIYRALREMNYVQTERNP